MPAGPDMQECSKPETGPSGEASGLPQSDGNRPTRASVRRSSRLRTRNQLTYVRERGKSRAGKLCVVGAADPRDGMPRVAVITSRRYSLKAVSRNRARRLLREAYRRLLPQLRTAWIVLIPRRRMQQVKMEAVLAEMTGLCRELGLLRCSNGSETEGQGERSE